jgi:guanylate kinase
MSPSLPFLLVLSAPSGGGKTTLCDQLLAGHSDVTRAVTCTTRSPRPGEQHGVHYHFLSRDEFLEKVSAGEFLEHASVYENFYGTLKSEVIANLQSGRHVLLSVDVQGANAIRLAASGNPDLASRLVTVFLTPPSLSDLERRLVNRQSESPESLALRLKVATIEVAEWRHFDYLLISTTIAEDLRRMEVILESELMRQTRSTPPQF